MYKDAQQQNPKMDSGRKSQGRRPTGSQGIDGKKMCGKMQPNCCIQETGIQLQELGVTGGRKREAVTRKQAEEP
jgi:hypothetical protein